MIKDLSARAKSVRSGRTHVELRGFPPAEVEAIKKQMGDNVAVGYPKSLSFWGVAINADKKPFDDVRVRKALTLAIDRYDMAKTLYPLSGLGTVGGLNHPSTKWKMPEEELQQLPGFWKDNEASLKEAKRLLTEAGYSNRFKTALHNRAVKLPYIDFGVYLVSAWKKIGVEAEHKLVESASWIKDLRSRNFALAVNPAGSITGDPDEHMVRWTSTAPSNYGRFNSPRYDELFLKQQHEIDEAKRIEIVHEMQREVLENTHWLSGLFWTRIEVRSSRIKNYSPHPSHWDNRRLQNVWLAKE